MSNPINQLMYASPVTSMIAGQQAAQQQQSGQQQLQTNAFALQQAQNQAGRDDHFRSALSSYLQGGSNGLAEMYASDPENAMKMQTYMAQQNQMAYQAQVEKGKQGYAQAQQVISSASPADYLRVLMPDAANALAQANNKKPEDITDAEAVDLAKKVSAKAAAQAGIMPAGTDAFTLKEGEHRFEGGKDVGSVPQKRTVEYKDAGSKLVPVYSDTGQNVPGLQPIIKGLPPTSENRKPQLVDVPQPDGTIQKQWVVPGQSAGTNVGESTVPAGSQRLQVLFNRVVSSANEASASVKNIANLPFATTSSGWLGIGGARKGGSPEAISAGLKNSLSTEDVQRYNAIVPGLARNLAGLEAAGSVPSESQIASMQSSIVVQPGDTAATVFTRLAEARQIAERGLETFADNAGISGPQKDRIASLTKDLQKAVPFSVQDVTDMLQGKNRKPTIAETANSALGRGNPAVESASAPVKVSTPAEAMKLPSGTQFMTPDGRIKVRP